MELTVLKTKIYVSPLFFAVLTAFLLIDKSGIAGKAVLFSLLHETGHFLALLCVKSSPKLVLLSVFGIGMELPANLSTARKCTVLMAGFTVNFILSALFFMLGKNIMAYINLAIGLFTAMPLASTDGGAILKMLLEEFFPQKAEICFKTISLAFLAVISIFVIFTVFLTGNYFLFIALFYMALCAIKTAA